MRRRHLHALRPLHQPEQGIQTREPVTPICRQAGCGRHSVADRRPPKAAIGQPSPRPARGSIRPVDVLSKESDGPIQEPPLRAGVLHAQSGSCGQAGTCSPAALDWVFLRS
jgi:hypothetical protein